MGILYRPNTRPKANIYYYIDTFIATIKRVNAENKQHVIMGDINLDLLQFDVHKKNQIPSLIAPFRRASFQK